MPRLFVTILLALTLGIASRANAGDDGGGQGCLPGEPCFLNYIAPPIAGLPPIGLPPGVGAPPQTTAVPTPTFPPILDLAEAQAGDGIKSFQSAHGLATANATGASGADSFTLKVGAHINADFFSYAIPETASTVQVTYIERSGTHSRILAAVERSASGSMLSGQLTDFYGGFIDAQFDDNVFTSLSAVSENAGELTGHLRVHLKDFLHPVVAGAIDFSEVEGYIATDLTGPDFDLVLSAFHAARDEYVASVPEPGALMLAGIAMVVGIATHFRRC